MLTQKVTVTIHSHTFFVKVAGTPEEIEQGLEKKLSMPIDHGMLFIFSEASTDLDFYMEDVYIPLDMIFIHGNTIVSIEKNVSPLPKNEKPIYYNPTAPADRVLEINAGLSDTYGFKEGSKVTVSLS